MKLFINFLAVVLLAFLSYFAYCDLYSQSDSENKNTNVYVINNTNDSVVVYLTLGSDTNYVTDVKGIFGIKTSGLQGSFVLYPKDSVSYQSPNKKGFSGNITFGTPPINCPDTTLFPDGINIFEFSLNNNFKGVKDAQETIDISCVSGVNSKILCAVSENNWNAGEVKDVKSFENSFLYDNVYRVGVFPFGCDSCTVIKNPPVCVGHKPFSQPQKKSICNVQRDARLKGGNVYVSFGGYLKGVIN